MRSNLSITQVMPIRSGTGQKGPYEALNFTAISPAGVQAKYGIFNKKELFPFILQGAPIDAEVIDKPSGQYDANSNEFINHNVVNIYVNDKPVIQQQQGGRSGYGKSPEAIRLEHELDMELEAMKRQSIERQTALIQAIELAKLTPGIVPTVESILTTADKFVAWEGKLRPTPAPPPAKPKDTPEKMYQNLVLSQIESVKRDKLKK